MKILKLTAENMKRLKAVEISPDGNLVRITGRNGQGKTSVLDSIWWALAGQKNIQEHPVREGEKKARVTLDLGDLIVERRFTQKGTVLEVKNKDGLKYATPQSILDALTGKLSFDPLAFMRMDKKAQFDALQAMAGFDLSGIDQDRKAAFENRTEVNRALKQKRAALEQMGPLEDVGAHVDASDLLKEIQQALTRNRETETARQESEDLLLEAGLAETRVKKLKEELAQAERDATEKRALATKAMEQSAAMGYTPVEPLKEKLTNLEEHNRKAKAFQDRKELSDIVQGLEQKAAELTTQIQDLDKDKLDIMAKVAFPVPGLSFGDGVVLYNGRPLDQASGAEQLRVSMGIAMAGNPDLKVVRVTDGSLLDSESMRTISEMATDKDFQVWIEQVDETGQVGIVIEDGEVVAVNPETVVV